MNQNSKTIEIFYYNKLKDKAWREINRLRQAEDEADEITAMDQAVNAAFTIYHLLEWKDKDINPNNPKTAHDLCNKSGNDALKMLHKVVTHNKHAVISSTIFSGNHLPNLKEEYIGIE